MDKAQEQSLRLPEQLVLALLHEHHQLTRPELVELTGLPRTTVVSTVLNLVEKGHAEQELDSTDARRAGRPAGTIRPRRKNTLVALIELARSGTVLSIATRTGTVLASQPVDATRFLKTQEFARRIKAALATLMPANSVVDAVVFSIPGAFVPGAGVKYVRHVAPELAQKFPQFEPPAAWLESDPTDPLSEALGLAVITENDSNLAALGEAHFGASQNTKSSIHVSLLNGAGSGIVIDGALYRGGSGVAGEIAHVTVDPDGRLCACGNRGCLITAAYATGPSLVRQVADAYEHPMTLNDVLHLADAGDVGVIRILNDYGRLVGEALAGFTALFDPEMIVVDAALREAGHAVRDGIEETLQRRLQPMISESVTVAVGQLKSDAQLLGAVSLSNDMALRELIGPYSRR